MAQRHVTIFDRPGVSQRSFGDHRLRDVDAGIDEAGRTREQPIDLVPVAEADLKDALLCLHRELGEHCRVEAGVRPVETRRHRDADRAFGIREVFRECGGIKLC
jgi:hypothetical protein